MKTETTFAGQLDIAHRVSDTVHPRKITVDAFLAGMRRFPAAVNVITTQCDGEQSGLTATAVCSLSSEPPRLLACVNAQGRSYHLIRSSGAFVVNALSIGQEGLAHVFASPKTDKTKEFDSGDWVKSKTFNLPSLSTANCSFECSVCEVIDSGSHALLIADIVDVCATGAGAPLLYCDGTYSGLLAL